MLYHNRLDVFLEMDRRSQGLAGRAFAETAVDGDEVSAMIVGRCGYQQPDQHAVTLSMRHEWGIVGRVR